MAIRMKEEGLTEVIKLIYSLDEQAEFVAAMSLYDGAAVMADAVTAEAKTIKTEPFHYAAVEGVTYRLPSPEEKKIVTDSGAMGISKFRKRKGAVDTSVGYNGSGYAPVNWNHMRSSARTNYKSVSFKGRDVTASSTLQWIRNQGGSAKYGISATIGRGAQNMKPIGVIANSINSGTSFMKKQPFVRRAVTKATPKAIQAIISRAESMINSIIKNNESGRNTA